MFSTPEERSVLSTPSLSRATSPIRATSPPTIEQIAMGLHISRTPYLGPQFLGGDSVIHGRNNFRASAAIGSHPNSRPGTAGTSSSSTRVAIPATPLRSSLKKSNSNNSKSALEQSRSTSPSASASSIPSTPRSQSTIGRLFHHGPSSVSDAGSTSSSGTGIGSRSRSRSRLDRFLWRGVKGVGRRNAGDDGIASVNSSDTELSTSRKAVRFTMVAEDGGSLTTDV
jgi:hypothetical protein